MSLPPQNVGKSLSSPPPQSHSPAGAASSSSAPAPGFGFDHAPRRPSQQSSAGSSSTGGNLGNSVAAPRKNQAARKQHRNKRPPGGNNGSSNYNPDDDYAMAELRAIRNSNSRRGQTSITHLLNYSVPSRTYLEHTYGSSLSRSSRSHHGYGGGHGSHGGGGHMVDKARFVHANYRFVVNPTGDYTTQAADADEYLDWANVMQILASAESQATACPICLSEPVAPRMARCGHVFCLPCLIRFMHAVDEPEERPRTIPGAGGVGTGGGNSAPKPERRAKWKKCPICEDSIYLAEVRPVRFYAGQESPLPRPGDDVVLRLMMRHAHSIVALPREGGADVLNASIQPGSKNKNGRNLGGGTIPWHFAANVLDYARIMKGTGDYMVEQFNRELEDLDRQEKEDELMFHEDSEWTQKAMRAVRTAQDKARELGGMEVALLDGTGSSGSNNNSSRGSDATSSGGPSLPPPLRPETSQAASSSASSQQDFFFYMSPPHLYLSPLDIRILKTKYGSFSSFPSTLLPRVEHLSAGHVVDDAMRRRAKYLGHLPAGCVVSFLECDWTDIVPADTLATFADDIERRRKRNRDKAAQEERERIQAERLEAAALHKGRRIRSSMASGPGTVNGSGSRSDDDDHFVFTPAVDINDFQPLAATTNSNTAATASGGEDDASSSSPHRPQTGFAHLASMSTSPSTGRTVWGTRAVAATDEDYHDYYDNSRRGGVDDDGWLKDEQVFSGPGIDKKTFGPAFSDAEIAAQMQALGVGPEPESAPAASGGGGGGGASKKKKKKQKITLMSTGGRRGI